ncbi:glycosyltransferase family 8 protein [Phormidium sp. CLA17]|uniref:glycosyltransferase family 8 protein n=1 Tax=Leptolyngbya sp. Cla-17 TaxID=2803751 RepID=UPI0019339A43|nr:glycosyltransferase family 8 protein [Leptolyngbya sp. Cla-17]MBM0744652.1 glycosyltransferase family 8 protein [Leptolyngbya sp. Cla-17]
MELCKIHKLQAKPLQVLPCESEEIIHIVFCIDKNYIQHLGCAMTSVCVNNHSRNIEFHIICDELQESDLEKFSILSNLYRRCISFYLLGKDNPFKELKISLHASPANYYRLAIPYVLSEGIHKVLYLDADLVCNAELTDLWNTNINDFPLAACPINDQERIDKLELASGRYFNTGVMLINLNKWMNDQVSIKAIEFIEQKPELIRFWDQDGINKIIDGGFKSLDAKWNNTIYMDRPVFRQVEGAAIIHFVGALKPWQKCSDTRKEIYWNYLKMSPWSDAYLNRERVIEEMIIEKINFLILSVFRKARQFKEQNQLLKKLTKAF